VDTHAATQEAAVAGLQGVVDWVLDDDWRWWLWLVLRARRLRLHRAWRAVWRKTSQQQLAAAALHPVIEC
jgi:hypothetical protein